MNPKSGLSERSVYALPGSLHIATGLIPTEAQKYQLRRIYIGLEGDKCQKILLFVFFGARVGCVINFGQMLKIEVSVDLRSAYVRVAE